jgi:hypothetical protein
MCDVPAIYPKRTTKSPRQAISGAAVRPELPLPSSAHGDGARYYDGFGSKRAANRLHARRCPTQQATPHGSTASASNEPSAAVAVIRYCHP